MVVYPIPQPLLDSRGDMVLAVRCTFDRARTLMPIGPLTGIYLLSSESAPREQSYANAHDTLDDWVLLFLSLLTGIVALSLYLALRSQREYLAVAVYSLAAAGYNAVWLWEDWRFTTSPALLPTESPSARPTWPSLNLSGWCLAANVRARFSCLKPPLLSRHSDRSVPSPASATASTWVSLPIIWPPSPSIPCCWCFWSVAGLRGIARHASCFRPSSSTAWRNGTTLFVRWFSYPSGSCPWPFFSLPVGTYSFTAADIGFFVFYVTCFFSWCCARCASRASVPTPRPNWKLRGPRSSCFWPAPRVHARIPGGHRLLPGQRSRRRLLSCLAGR